MSDSEDFSDDEDFRPRPGAIDLDSLPPDVIRRVKALKNLQFANIKHEVAYYNEVHKLDLKYKKLYDENNEQRRKIFLGEQEPTDKEADWKDPETEEDVIKKMEKLDVDKDNQPPVKGIPNFWLTAFQNSNEGLFNGVFQPIDEPIFKYLEDITLTLPEKNTGFILNFHFGSNEFFTNQILTKEYEMKSEIDMDDPLDFDGPEIFRSKGCKIEWKSGKNTTVKVIKQKVKQKGKGKGGQKFVTKNEKRESFFNFFSPPKVPDDPKEEVADEQQALINEDFEVGFNIKEKLIPKAVLYFTGEALEDDDDDFEDDSEDDADEESDV